MNKLSLLSAALLAGLVSSSALAAPSYRPGDEKEDRVDLVAGTWTVHENGVENKSIRMVFDKHHKFKFVCSGAKSEGTYEIHDGAIYLTYEKVDGEPVSFDSKKRLPIADDWSSFKVDTYRYERSK